MSASSAEYARGVVDAHLGLKRSPTRRLPGRALRASDSIRLASTARPSIPPRMPTSRCSFTALLYPRVAGDAKLDLVYAAIEMPVREVLFRDGARGRDARRGAARGAEPGARREGDGARAAGLRAGRAAVQPRSPKQLGEILFEKMKLPAVRKTATGAAVDRRGRAERARRRLPAAEAAARVPRTGEAQVDVHRQAAADGQPRTGRVHTNSARRPRSPAGSRPRPEPAEHPGPHGGGPADPRGVRRAAGQPRSCRPTTRRSSCASWRTCPATPRSSRRSRRRGHASRRPPPRSSACRSRRSPSTSAVTSRRSTSG